MTDHEINWTIAEQLGWKKHPEDKFIVTDPAYPHSVQPIGSIPDYCNDLNSVHEAEKVLEEKGLVWKYEMTLGRNGGARFNWSKIHATARQRAEAFLRTLGKFKE